MALFKTKAADQLIESNEKYVIGGHSLGSAMAARYANQSKNKNLKGIFFLAAYPDQKGRLDHKKLAALSITASRDGILNWQKYRKVKNICLLTQAINQSLVVMMETLVLMDSKKVIKKLRLVMRDSRKLLLAI